ncbi:MAG TPA: L17 family ribosomal protein, partial [Thermoguttaceae bacterium]|nr:L17 family ribosomal protein [Thermoguttaceae bacterium]
APRMADRPGGYTRILRLAKPRVGDAGTRAILEFVGKHDRKRKKTVKTSFEPVAAEAKSSAPATPSSSAVPPTSEQTASEGPSASS